MSAEAETVPESRVGSKYYLVAAGVPSLALTLLDGGDAPGTKIIIQEYEPGRTDQQWLVSQGPNGGKLYKNVAGNLYIGNSSNLSSQSLVNGQRVSNAVEFREVQGDKGVTLHPYSASGVSLDNQSQGSTSPNPVWFYQNNGTIAQVWTFKSVN